MLYSNIICIFIFVNVILWLQGQQPCSLFFVIGGDFRMPSGTVKWFNDAKGYGFISTDDGEDIFVHHTEIQGEGFKTLAEGDKVEFEVVKGDKGNKAQKVVKL